MYSTRAFCKKRPEFGHCVSQRCNVTTLWRNITSWRHVHGDGCLQTPVVYDHPFNFSFILAHLVKMNYYHYFIVSNKLYTIILILCYLKHTHITVCSCQNLLCCSHFLHLNITIWFPFVWWDSTWTDMTRHYFLFVAQYLPYIFSSIITARESG